VVATFAPFDTTFGLVALGAADIRRAGIFLICLVAAIALHEFSHAKVADWLGDPTPRREGRVTLNPLAHADPVGTVLLPIVFALSGSGMLFGWGRPVPTNPVLYRREVSMRGGMALVALAGPAMNLLLAIVSGVAIGLVARFGVPIGTLSADHPLFVFYTLNIVLFAFNLIPIHPLDGGKILAWALGAKRQHVDDFLRQYGPWILLALVILPPGRVLLGFLMQPLYRLAEALVVAIAG